MILGLRTTQFHVKPDSLAAVRDWYARSLGVKPYFDEPFYVGFSLGGFEFGLVPDDNVGSPGSIHVYWGVTDIDAAVASMVACGAIDEEGIQDVGAGIRKANIRDPFGNRFGLIENPHFQQSSASA